MKVVWPGVVAAEAEKRQFGTPEAEQMRCAHCLDERVCEIETKIMVLRFLV